MSPSWQSMLPSSDFFSILASSGASIPFTISLNTFFRVSSLPSKSATRGCSFPVDKVSGAQPSHSKLAGISVSTVPHFPDARPLPQKGAEGTKCKLGGLRSNPASTTLRPSDLSCVLLCPVWQRWWKEMDYLAIFRFLLVPISDEAWSHPIPPRK